MKIGTLTFHRARNFGAILQTYALVKKLNDLGADAEVIDYRPSFNETRFQKPKLQDYLSLREIYSLIFRNSFQRYNHKGFENFIEDYIPLSSKTPKSKDELIDVIQNYDVIISGSDQVWNPSCTKGDLSYFLPFHKKNSQIKAAYAPSIGRTSFSASEENEIVPLISDFDYLSVRETQGNELLRNLGFDNCSTVLDPTLLLTRDEWEYITDFSCVPRERYLLIYVMYEDMDLLNFAKQYAKNHGLKIAYISQRLFHRLSGASYFDKITPTQWVGLFLNAHTIVTNSFHGTAFGLNFSKNLFVKRIPNSKANSRLEDILNLVNYMEAFIDGKEGIDSIESTKPKEYVQFLNEQRDKSLSYLKNIINHGNLSQD